MAVDHTSHQEHQGRLVSLLDEVAQLETAPPNPVADAVWDMLLWQEITLFYVVLTALIAKNASPIIDALSLQKGGNTTADLEPYDARSYAGRVVVPVFAARFPHIRYSSNKDPLVNNGARVPRVTDEGKRRKEAWREAMSVLGQANADASTARALLVYALWTICEKEKQAAKQAAAWDLQPHNDISVGAFETGLADYLVTRTHGRRWQHLVAAVHYAEQDRFGFWASVRTADIHSADMASGMMGDVEAITAKDNICFISEAKDRRLAAEDVHASLSKAENSSFGAYMFFSSQSVPVEVRHLASNPLITHGRALQFFDKADLMQRCRPVRDAVLKHLYKLGNQEDRRRLDEIFRTELPEIA
jgi:hypothetical protein